MRKIGIDPESGETLVALTDDEYRALVDDVMDGPEIVTAKIVQVLQENDNCWRMTVETTTRRGRIYFDSLVMALVKGAFDVVLGAELLDKYCVVDARALHMRYIGPLAAMKEPGPEIVTAQILAVDLPQLNADWRVTVALGGWSAVIDMDKETFFRARVALGAVYEFLGGKYCVVDTSGPDVKYVGPLAPKE